MPGDDGRQPCQKNRRIGPVVPVLLGMAIALGLFIALIAMEFTLADLAWAVPVLAVAALLIFMGARRLKGK